MKTGGRPDRPDLGELGKLSVCRSGQAMPGSVIKPRAASRGDPHIRRNELRGAAFGRSAPPVDSIAVAHSCSASEQRANVTVQGNRLP
jgi:hypothetical protein